MNISSFTQRCRTLNPARRVHFLLLFGWAAVAFVACDSEDTGPKGKYTDGTVIVNEGGFGSANGTLSFYPVDGEVEPNIFRNALGQFAGDVVQSITFHGDKGYIVINGDNKIEIVNSNTFESAGTFTNALLDKPRYVEVVQDKAYISVWGPYGDGGFSLVDSYILVVDLNTLSVLKKIETDEGVEELVRAGGYLFATNYNYGGSNTVAVIDLSDDTLVDQLVVGSGPAGVVTDGDGKVWILCTGDFGSANGTLVRINPESLKVERTLELHVNPDVDLALSADKNNLLYTAGKAVFQVAVGATEAPADPFFLAEDVIYNYALGVDPARGDIWIGDAGDFSSAGKVYIYSAAGTYQRTVAVGIGPTQFVFK